MNKIIVPIDFAGLSPNAIDYLCAACRDFAPLEIVLVRSFYQSDIEKILPSPDMLPTDVMMPDSKEIIVSSWLNKLLDELREKMPSHTVVSGRSIRGKLLTAITLAIEMEAPDMMIIINDSGSRNADLLIAGNIIEIAEVSTISVLLIPFQAVYQPLKKILIPTTFRHLERLHNFKKICSSQAWLNAEIVVLNIDQNGANQQNHTKNVKLLENYLEGYSYHIDYMSGNDPVRDILRFAEISNVQVIFALPAEHSFWYSILHSDVTRTFALKSQYPVFLLK